MTLQPKYIMCSLTVDDDLFAHWHGLHHPFGIDVLKLHAMLVDAKFTGDTETAAKLQSISDTINAVLANFADDEDDQ